MKQKLIFRVDADNTIGRGHLSRSLAVASMAKDDFEVVFMVLQSSKTYIEDLGIDFPLVTLSSNEELLDVVQKEDFVWLDGYQFSEDFKKKLQSKVDKLIETNDIPYTPKHVDVLVNQTPGLIKAQFGETKTQLVLGLEFALLRKSFLDHAKANKRQLNGEGVFVCFGGADTFNLGFKCVDKLIKQGFTSPIYWVTAKSQKELNFPANVEVLSNLVEQEMIDYMLKCKVLLISSSVLSFEAIALRKPFFTGYFVDNQKRIFEGLKEHNLAACFGYLETDKDVEKAIDSFLQFYTNSVMQQQIIDNHVRMIDGNSDKRLMAVLKGSL